MRNCNRISVWAVVATLVLGICAGQGARAAGQESGSVIEKGLLGIRMLSSYQEVMRAFGEPTEVYRRDVVVQLYDTRAGAIVGFGNNFVTKKMIEIPLLAGTDSGAAGGGAGMSGLTGFGAGGGGGGGGGGEATQEDKILIEKKTFKDAGGFIWVYYYPNDMRILEFIFNADNRIEIIIERGLRGGGKTRKGIGLGSSVSTVLRTYGWPERSEMEGRYIGLNYGTRNHLHISIINNRVVAVEVDLREDQHNGNVDLAFTPTVVPGSSAAGAGGRR